MSKQICRAIVRMSHTAKYTARMLQQQYQLPVSVRRVQQILSSAEFCEFEKRKSAPMLSAAIEQLGSIEARSFWVKSNNTGIMLFSQAKKDLVWMDPMEPSTFGPINASSQTTFISDLVAVAALWCGPVYLITERQN